MAEHGHGGQAAVSCQMCEQSTQIKKKCLDCGYLLCANCCQLHKKIKELSDHQLVDLSSIGPIKERDVVKINFKNIECKRHDDQKCCLFCEDCDKLVCAICISERHNQHKMIQMSDGHKFQINKISTWRSDIKKKINTLTADMTTLDTNYSTENSKYNTEKEKVLRRDKVLKEAVDTQTKTLIHDLDQRWYRINKSFKDEISNSEKYKQQLQFREEQLKQALESRNPVDVFRTVEKQKERRSDLDRPVNLKYETLPTFKTREINLPAMNSQHGSFLDNTSITSIKKDIKIHVEDSYKTDSISLDSIACNADGTLWINFDEESVLKCVKKCENMTLSTTIKLERNISKMAVAPNGDLFLSVGETYLLKIPHKQKSMVKSQYSVEPLVTTQAVHASSDKIIVGAKEPGPLYPAHGPRQIIVMDTNGKHEKVYQFDSEKRPLFTNPRKVTKDSMNNLYVLDRRYNSWSGRVVIINNHIGKINIYNGNPKVNSQENPFTPGDLVATKSDNIVVSDKLNHLLHILNSNGECMKYINTEEYGMKWPWCLDIDKNNLLHIGCDKKLTLKVAIGLSSGAKLHVVKFTGF